MYLGRYVHCVFDIQQGSINWMIVKPFNAKCYRHDEIAPTLISSIFSCLLFSQARRWDSFRFWDSFLLFIYHPHILLIVYNIRFSVSLILNSQSVSFLVFNKSSYYGIVVLSFISQIPSHLMIVSLVSDSGSHLTLLNTKTAYYIYYAHTAVGCTHRLLCIYLCIYLCPWKCTARPLSSDALSSWWYVLLCIENSEQLLHSLAGTQ